MRRGRDQVVCLSTMQAEGCRSEGQTLVISVGAPLCSRYGREYVLRIFQRRSGLRERGFVRRGRKHVVCLSTMQAAGCRSERQNLVISVGAPLCSRYSGEYELRISRLYSGLFERGLVRRGRKHVVCLATMQAEGCLSERQTSVISVGAPLTR